MLNIGCGSRKISGYVNIDVIRGVDLRHDVRKGIPYPQGAVDTIYSEHFLEHLTQRDGLRFLRECRRVLKPGGIVRIAMPDLDALVSRYTREDWRGDGDMFRLGFEWVDNRCEMLNIAMREWGHRWVYNEEELRRVASLAGLIARGRMRWGESEVSELVGLEYRPGSKLIMEFSTRVARPESGLPVVSILIPAYRPQFLDTAIESALRQDYQNIELIVCDDCPTDKVRAVVMEYQNRDSRIRYVRNDPPKGPLDNYMECFARATGEYIQFLNDDDVLGEHWISEAVHVLEDNTDISLVACAREYIDELGSKIGEIGPISRTNETRVFEGRALVRFLVTLGLNPIGEPSACMFRHADIAGTRPHIMSVAGAVVRGLGDFSIWVNLLSKGDLAYLASTRCQIRQHASQWKNDPKHKELATGSWAAMRKHTARLGLYDGVYGIARCPNPVSVARGYKWRPFDARGKWNFGGAKFNHAAVFSYRAVRYLIRLLMRRGPVGGRQVE